MALCRYRYAGRIFLLRHRRQHALPQRRRDRTWQIFASLSSSLLEKYDITPTLQYTYVRRDSNIWTQEHERQRLNLSLGYRF